MRWEANLFRDRDAAPTGSSGGSAARVTLKRQVAADPEPLNVKRLLEAVAQRAPGVGPARVEL